MHNKELDLQIVLEYKYVTLNHHHNVGDLVQRQRLQ